MHISDFHFDLPDELIARYPLAERNASRLLQLDGVTGDIQHSQFDEIVKLIKPEDLVVFNNTKVIPARFFGTKPTGGKVEFLVERIESEFQAIVHLRSSNKTPSGTEISIEGVAKLTVVERVEDLYRVTSDMNFLELLNTCGHMPLPPYIDREDNALDQERYQTVYAEHEGAVAAPTAGLHFTDEILAQLHAQGTGIAYVTLHVGSGTFLPVRVENIEEHEMHSEWIDIDATVVAQIKQTRAKGGRIIAVGTTSVRTLESAALSGKLQATTGDTDIFIYPGYEFQVVDAMLTNFHLPESTLIMLVSAFSGQSNILNAYAEAVREKYRFFSYGDAMFLTRQLEITDEI
ncbi:MAG: tRNA preQ1(34) S-adenosylmethionine ribosyltransferase-isomerase QueA [Gammaproteobacteria bacterium]|nr:tRNA preQ1(34) S-adenosylmethionine ribosyltransferase-isomerase QueA [Gammaproteobacteria bacterium]